MKYFVLGAIASGTLLYGISMLYGMTGTLQLDELAARVGARSASAIGCCFGARVHHRRRRVQVRRRAVPHVGAGRLSRRADARDAVHRLGAEDRVVRAGDAACSPKGSARWSRQLAGHADRAVRCCRWSIGNVVAIAQTNIKRMLAYSTISHVGFILLGILAGTNEGYRAAMFYTFAYVHDGGGCLRHDPAAVAQRLRGRAARGLQGPERAQPVVRGRHADGHVQHGRRAAVHRLLGEAGGASAPCSTSASRGSPRSRSCCR